jgi:SAM-dependent methyltransferase
MKKEILSIICCPTCYGNFALSDVIHSRGDIYSGTLVCTQCNAQYPIVDSLPIILDHRNDMAKTIKGFGEQWLAWNKGYFENGMIYGQKEEDELADFKHIFGISEPSQLSGKLILDAGCGSGRLTANIGRFANNALVVGVDISHSAQVAYKNTKDLSNVHIIQANLLRLPIRPRTFDYIWSEGVIHHTPNSRETFSCLDQKLSTTGSIYVWVYPNYRFRPYDLARKVLWKPYFLPASIRYCLSFLLGIPLFVLLKVLQKKDTFRSIVFRFFDSLTPEFQHNHSREEVEEWFSVHGYRYFRKVNDLGVWGRK